MAKLDTGASSCVFQYPYGKHIGLTVEEGDRQRISTVTGAFEAYQHWVNFQVLDLEFYGPVLFYPQHMPGRNVLGLHGFLNQFSQMALRYNQGEIFMAASDYQS